MTLVITYSLTGPGWAECIITFGKRQCKITASYISDALGDLVRGANAVLDGRSISFDFAEEPGSYRWSLVQSGRNQIQTTIYSVGRNRGDRRDSEGRPALSLFVPLSNSVERCKTRQRRY